MNGTQSSMSSHHHKQSKAHHSSFGKFSSRITDLLTISLSVSASQLLCLLVTAMGCHDYCEVAECHAWINPEVPIVCICIAPHCSSEWLEVMCVWLQSLLFCMWTRSFLRSYMAEYRAASFSF